MPRFFFDVFDGSNATVDDQGDCFAEAEDAMGQAVGMLADYARDLLPGDGSKDFGIAVRGDGGGDLYKAALMFREAYPDPTRPGTSQGSLAARSVTDPWDLIRQSREARRQAREIQKRLQEAVTQSRQAREQSQAARRRRAGGEVAEPATGCSPGVPRQAA